MNDIQDDLELSDWLAGATQSLDRELQQLPIVPDFAEVVARAHQLEPEMVTSDQVEEARSLRQPAKSDVQQGLTALSPLPRRQTPTTPVEQKSISVVAPATSSIFETPQGRVIPFRFRTAVVSVLSLAAVATLAWFIQGSSLIQNESTLPPQIAVHNLGESGTSEEAIRRSRQAKPLAPLHPSDPIQASPIAPKNSQRELVIDEHLTLASPPAEQTVTQKKRRRAKSNTPAKSRPSLDDQLKGLDQQAQQVWRDGNLSRADAIFRKIIRKGNGTRWAKLAYGDLMSIARQSKSGAKEVALWKEYLKKYPRGLFSDDARAGLCRRGASSNQAECWGEYLADFPSGAHRKRASDHLSREAGGQK